MQLIDPHVHMDALTKDSLDSWLLPILSLWWQMVPRVRA
jgi:hypothetical protein